MAKQRTIYIDSLLHGIFFIECVVFYSNAFNATNMFILDLHERRDLSNNIQRTAKQQNELHTVASSLHIHCLGSLGCFDRISLCFFVYFFFYHMHAYNTRTASSYGCVALTYSTEYMLCIAEHRTTTTIADIYGWVVYTQRKL